MSDNMKQEFEAFAAEMRADRNELKAGQDELKSLFRNLSINMARMGGDLAEVRRTMVTKDEFHKKLNIINGRLDSFAGEVDISRRERALQDRTFWVLKETLDGHDARLTRLESKRRS